LTTPRKRKAENNDRREDQKIITPATVESKKRKISKSEERKTRAVEEKPKESMEHITSNADETWYIPKNQEKSRGVDVSPDKVTLILFYRQLLQCI
jgi:hypothetical protein